MEIESDILNDAIGCEKYHKRVPEFGERAWLAEGTDLSVLYWDAGNGWCSILDIISDEDGKVGQLEAAERFYNRVEIAIKPE